MRNNVEISGISKDVSVNDLEVEVIRIFKDSFTVLVKNNSAKKTSGKNYWVVKMLFTWKNLVTFY